MSLLFKRTFLLVLIVGGLVAISWCLSFINARFGAEAAGASVLAMPILIIAVPLWYGLSDGNWLPLLLVCSWLGLCVILHEVARSLKTLEH